MSNCGNMCTKVIKCGFRVYSIVLHLVFILLVCVEARPNSQPKPNSIMKHPNLKLLPLETCGLTESNDKILNGNVTGVFEFPWMVLLSYQLPAGPKFECAGTIINQRYILTAAHCVTGDQVLPLTSVRVGDHDYKSPKDCESSLYGEEICAPPFQDIGIEEMITHPDYNPEGVLNDIALLRLDRDLDLETYDSVKAVCLPTGSVANLNLANRNGVVTGWGATEKASFSSVLLKVEVPIVSTQDCRSLYKNKKPISERQICAGGDGTRDSCNGDSGAPLQTVEYLNEDVRFVQHGILSYGLIICGLNGYPAIYTRVSSYMEWILDTIKL